MNLSQFLASHPPDAILKVVEWTSDGAERVRCVLETSPWWVDSARRSDMDGRLVIDCAGVLEAELRVGQRQSEVEDLEVLSDDPLLWKHRGPSITLYGNAPLSDPAGFFAALSDVVEHRFGMDSSASTFLGAPFADWRGRMTGAAPYLLIGGPAPLMEACMPLLDEQGADYSVVRAAGLMRDVVPQLVVVGESWIICHDAAVEVHPPICAGGAAQSG